MRRLLAALVAVGFAAPCAAETLLPPDPGVSIGRTVSFDGFVDENDRPFVAGPAAAPPAQAARPWIVSPMYTRCPHTCSALTTALRRALESSGLRATEYRVLSFSFDPKETGEGLRTFRDRLDVPPSWPTLRASDAASLQRTLASLDFRTVARGDGEFDHPNLVAVLTPDFELAGYVFGVNFSPTELARTVRRARTGVSWIDRWQAAVFFVAAMGFVGSTLAFVFLLHRRRARRGAHTATVPSLS
jgi:cytochrome oxidase Cu insertion factor (SCO1/SenC/PrrC family)